MIRRPGFSTSLIAFSIVVGVLDIALNARLHHALRDTVRWVELVEGAWIVMVCVVILRRYFENLRADPSKARLLPRHVVRMAAGLIVLVVGAVAQIVHLVGHPFVWYTSPIVFPALTLLATGLTDLVLWLPDRTAPPTNADRRWTDPSHNAEGRVA